MDVKKAAIQTALLIDGAYLVDDNSKIGKKHLFHMLRSIELGLVREEKAHRWLGWVQACLYITGVTLDELKKINHET